MGEGRPTVMPVPVHVVSRSRPFVVRYSHVALAGAGASSPPGRRALCDCDVRGGGRCIGGRADTARREARLRPCVRARLPLPPLHGAAGRIRAGVGPGAAGLEAAAHALSSAGTADRRAEQLPRYDRTRLGPRRRPDRGAREPGAAAQRRRSGSARARVVRLRRPLDQAEGVAGRAAGARARPRGASCSSETGLCGRPWSERLQSSPSPSESASPVRARGTRCSHSSQALTRPS